MAAQGPTSPVGPPTRSRRFPPSFTDRGSEKIRPEHLYKALALLLLVLFLFSHIQGLAQVLLMVYASAILGVALNTIVSVIPMQRRWVAGLLGVVIFGALGLAAWFGVPALADQIRGLTADLPQYREQLERWMERLREMTGLNLDLFGPETREVFSGFFSGGALLGTARGLVEGIFLPLVLVMGALYAAASPNDRLLVPILRTVPADRRDSYRRMFELLAVRLRAWVKGLLLSMLIIGALAALGLQLIGIPYPLLLGIFSGLFEIVPIVGPWVSGAVVVGVAALNEPSSALWAALLMLGIQQLEGNLITPAVMAKVAEIHPFVTLFSLFLNATLFGFLGIILSIPLVLLVWTVVQVFWVEGTLETDNDPIEPLAEE